MASSFLSFPGDPVPDHEMPACGCEDRLRRKPLRADVDCRRGSEEGFDAVKEVVEPTSVFVGRYSGKRLAADPFLHVVGRVEDEKIDAGRRQ